MALPKVELRSAVEEVVKETPEYRCMQSQFSVLYNESLQLKAHLDEARTLLHGTRGTHQRQVELIEVIVSFSCGYGMQPFITEPAIPSPALSSLCDYLLNKLYGFTPCIVNMPFIQWVYKTIEFLLSWIL